MKKGQAAMEFLMTYGWAILVVLAAIGALAYFGVLSPKNLLPSSCTVSAGFGCSNAKAVGTGAELILRNNMGEDIKEVEVIFSGDATNCGDLTVSPSGDDPYSGDWGISTPCDGSTDCVAATNANVELRNGKDMGRFVLSDDGSNECDFSGTASIDFEIVYTKVGESVSHTATGKANLKVE